MSLINDALKRANQAQRQRGVDYGIHSGRPMQAVEYSARANSKVLWFITGGALILLCMGASIFFFFKWRQLEQRQSVAPISMGSDRAPDTAGPIQVQDTNPVMTSDKVGTSVEKPPLSTDQTTSPAVQSIPSTNAREATKTESMATVTPAPQVSSTAAGNGTSVSFPEIQIKGIFLSARNPSVMIDGYVYRIGDGVRGAKIIRIEQDGVWFEFQGRQKKVLAY